MKHSLQIFLGFSFFPPVSFETFTASFSSRIFILTLFHWLKKSDYSSLEATRNNYFIVKSLLKSNIASYLTYLVIAWSLVNIILTCYLWYYLDLCDMVKHELRVASYDLLVTSWKLKSMSWNSNMQVQIHELWVQFNCVNELQV